MKRFYNLLKSATLVLLAVSFASFGVAALASLIDSSISMVFWYLGLTSGWIILLTAVVAVAGFLFDHGRKWINSHFHQIAGNNHHPPHAAI